MILLVMLAFSFNLFKLSENRVCWGVSGKVCCDGFVLNQTTGLCQKCPEGYFRDNCSEKCSPPNYGEDCQSICQCPDIDCHFVTGCFQNTEAFTYHWQLSSKKELSDRHKASITFTIWNGTISYQTTDHVFLMSATEHEDSTLIYLTTNNDLFKNSLVINLVRVIVSLVGVFVFFFAVCVVANIYFKCYRQTTNAKGTNTIHNPSEYKSLNFEAAESECQLHPDPQQQVNLGLTYLTPVFRNNEKRETSSIENDTLADIPIQTHSVSPHLTDTSKLTTANVHEHVYIEII